MQGEFFCVSAQASRKLRCGAEPRRSRAQTAACGPRSNSAALTALVWCSETNPTTNRVCRSAIAPFENRLPFRFLELRIVDVVSADHQQREHRLVALGLAGSHYDRVSKQAVAA